FGVRDECFLSLWLLLLLGIIIMNDMLYCSNLFFLLNCGVQHISSSSMRLSFLLSINLIIFFFSSRRRHTRSKRDWSSDVCSSDLLAEQKESLLKKWERISLPIVTGVASPYEETVDITKPAETLKQQGATMIVLDCMGYTQQHKKEVLDSSNLPTLLSKSLTASVVKEYLI